jgi:hypothetical protein
LKEPPFKESEEDDQEEKQDYPESFFIATILEKGNPWEFHNQ